MPELLANLEGLLFLLELISRCKQWSLQQVLLTRTIETGLKALECATLNLSNGKFFAPSENEEVNIFTINSLIHWHFFLAYIALYGIQYN